MQVEELIKTKFKIEPLDMKEDSSIDVKEKNIKILAYNSVQGRNEFCRVNKVIRKPDLSYNEVTMSDDSLVKCTDEHKFYVKISPNLDWSYMTVSDMKLNSQKYPLMWIKGVNKTLNVISIHKKEEKVPIFDLEIEGVHNLYTNGVLSHNSMGDTNVPTGGNAWKFYPDIRIKIYKQLDRENETNETTIEVIKNKCAKPYGKCKIPIAWGVGIDKIQEIINEAVEMGIIKRAGAWYSYMDNKLGMGEAKVKALLEDNPELLEEVKQKVLNYKPEEKEVVKGTITSLPELLGEVADALEKM